MGVAKVILNGDTLIDVTQKTVASNNLLSGITALGADGEGVVGTYVAPTFSTQSKTVTPTESSQSIFPDSGYDGLSRVTVNGISSTYVGTGVARKSSADLTASGSVVTAPSGYYATAATKNVTAGTAFTPAVIITANPTISVDANGLVTAGVSTNSNIAPTVNAGYISSGTSGKVSVSGTKTYQLTSLGATTYTPTTTNQVINSGRYLVGNQTVLGDANLVPENIADGVSIFGISGTHQGGGGGDDQLKSFIERTISGIYSNSEISYIGSGAFMGFSRLTEINVSNVTSISTYAFCSCVSLSSVNNLFSQLSTITAYAFSGCTSLRELSSPTIGLIATNAFNGCSRLSVINLPNVKSILSNAFYSCYSIEQINFPSMSSSITSSAFYGCRRLYSISLPLVKTIDSSAFALIGTSIMQKPNVYMPNVSLIRDNGFYMAFYKSSSYAVDFDFPSLSSIGSSVFGQVHINTFSAPNLKSIGEGAFSGAHIYDENFTLPSCTAIASRAFSGAYLSKINLPNATTIGENAFVSCYGLSEINAPKLTTIGSYAFSGCSSLLSISAPSVTTIWNNAFNYCSYLSQVDFPVLTKIRGAAFTACTRLRTVSLPKVSEIENYGFSTAGVASAYLPSCTLIGSLAFTSCTTLSLIVFENVYYIGSSAFRNCNLLTSVYFLGTRIPEMVGVRNVFYSTPILGYDVFTSEPGYIYVLSTMYSKWQAAAQYDGGTLVSITASEADAIRSLFSS